MTMDKPQGHRFGWQRAWPLWILAGFFGIIFIANGILVYLANTSWTGLTTEQAYEKGRAYNSELARVDAQNMLGWTAEFKSTTLASNGQQQVRLELIVTQKDNTPLTQAKARALLVRPTHEGYDREITLIETAPGHFTTNVDLPLPGLWEIRAAITSSQGEYRLVERITVE